MSRRPKQSAEEGESPQEVTARDANGPSEGADAKVAPGPELEAALREAVVSVSETESAAGEEASAEGGADPAVMVGTPAIVCARYGEGRVLVSSGHAEWSSGLESFLLRYFEWAGGRRD